MVSTVPHFYISHHIKQTESLEGFYLLAAFGKWFPKPLSNLLPPGMRPPAQKLRWSSWPWFFLAPPPFPFVAPLPPQGFLASLSCIHPCSVFFIFKFSLHSLLILRPPGSLLCPHLFLSLFLSCVPQSFWTFVSVQSTEHHYSSFSPKGVPWRERSTRVATRVTVLFSYKHSW